MVQNQGERKLQQAAFKWSKHECTESPPLRAVIGSANGAYLGGGIRGAISWAILKSTGASAGYPDFFIHRRGHNGEIGLAIEFKVGDNDLTPDQKWWREELLAEGNEYKVVRSLAGFKKELHEYLHGPPPPPQRKSSDDAELAAYERAHAGGLFIGVGAKLGNGSKSATGWAGISIDKK